MFKSSSLCSSRITVLSKFGCRRKRTFVPLTLPVKGNDSTILLSSAVVLSDSAAKGKFADEDVEDEQVRHYRPISKGYL